MMSAPQPYPTVGSHTPAPDDAQIESKMPSICVDYLSHGWAEEDVWSSWKAMTKRKNEIANGVRLENASWRTWAKQRGNLKTISPETLNWLKDSDVTWLYGPLHEHVDSVPPPKIASAQDRLDLVDMSQTKSILKHRTISEMLTTPGRSASPTVDKSFDDEDDEDEAARDARLRRGTIFAVKSDSNIQGKNAVRKRGSPPITPSEQLLSHPSLGNRTDSAASSVDQEKRHISFNQRVDQCISIDVDAHEYDDDEEEDDYEDDEMNASSDEERKHKDGLDSSEDDDDDDEQILTMKASPRMSPSLPMTTTSSLSSRNSSPGASDHQTIAKLAPTLLKTTGNFPSPSPAVVDPSGIAESRSHSPSPQNSSPSGTPGATKVNSSTGGHVNPANMFDTPQQEAAPPNPQRRQWDEDEEFSSNNFDYFNGPDMGGDYELDHSTSNSDRSKGNPSSSDSNGLDGSDQGRSGWISPGSSSSSGSSSNGNSQSTATSNPVCASNHATTSSTRDSDEFQSKGGATFSLGSPPTGNQSGSGQPPSLPRSILKRRSGNATTSQDQNHFDEDGDFDILANNSQNNASKVGSLNNDSLAAGSSSESLDSSSGGGDRERGRPAQRLGSSASYERLQEAASKSSGSVGVGSSSVGAGGSRGRSGSSSSTGNSLSPNSSPYGSYEQVSHVQKASGSHPPPSSKNQAGSNRRKPSPQQQQQQQQQQRAGSSSNQVGSPPNSPSQQSGKFRPQERRDSFREGERPTGLGPSSSNQPPTASTTGDKSEKKSSRFLNGDGEDDGAFDSSEEDTDGNEAPHTAGKDEVELKRAQNQMKAKDQQIKHKGKSSTAPASTKSSSNASPKVRSNSRSSTDSNRSLESSSFLPESPLNIDTSNVPPNQNPKIGNPEGSSSSSFGDSPASQLPGPTPLNTPTFALAKSRSNRKKADGKNKALKNGKAVLEDERETSLDDDGEEGSSNTSGSNPSSPVVPRRQSATGALVAPTHSGDLPRIPLADDYVDEDEGGIIGRAVEIVNTARDLIGALLGSGGAGGRSWREGGM